jgi:hypothetical protein
MLSEDDASGDELLLLEETLATLFRNHSGPNLIDSVIVSSKIQTSLNKLINNSVLNLLSEMLIIFSFSKKSRFFSTGFQKIVQQIEYR